MSSARLCLAGLLVAGGLILGAFTLHGYLAPNWEEQQSSAGGQARLDEKTLQVLQGRSRFVAREDRPKAAAGSAPQLPSPSGAPPKPRPKIAADSSVPKLPRKKVVDKAKPAPAQQQASFQWPWSLFNN